ncbi:MAG: hypothetical protein WCY78_05350 [Sphaerochaetaceae bacterium]
MKKVIIVIIVMLMALFVVSGANLTSSERLAPRFLQITNDGDSDYLVFNEKGVFVEPSSEPVALREGWMILAGQEPVVLQGPQVTILLQREAILAINSVHVERPSFYLVAGSASFLTPPLFLGSIEVSTPVGLYRMRGNGEMFVSSDFSELIFSLGGKIQVLNSITRESTELQSFTYLNLADPQLKAKEISRETYQTMSINPRKESARIQPKAGLADELIVQATSPFYDDLKRVQEKKAVAVEVAEEAPPKVEVVPEPKAVEVAEEAPPKVEVVPEPKEEQVIVKAPPVVREKEIYDVYIAHTGDTFGQIEGDGIGYARLATLLEWGRSLSDRNLLLDAGNSVSGTPLAEAFEGESVALLLDMLGYDAVAPSTADYAYGLEKLKEAAQIASQYSSINILAANILDANKRHLFDPYKIFNLNGYRVGVIGLSVSPANLAGVSAISDEVMANAQSLVDEVKQQSDFVILLGNTRGAPEGITSRLIAHEIEGIDLIIDGAVAETPEDGLQVGKTLIVNSDERLASVGLVAIHVVDGVNTAIEALRIRATDVDNPQSSALAQAFGIDYVPAEARVAAYISDQKALYGAQLLAKVEEEEEEQKEPEVSFVVEEEPVSTIALAPLEEEPAESALVIKEPAGITSSSEASKRSIDFGVRLTYNFTFDDFKINEYKMGISVNPYLAINDFAFGLQGYFLTSGELLSPTTWDITNIRFEGSVIDIVSSALHFIDYVSYGQKGDSFYLLADDYTPISFGNRTLVNNLGVASGPYEEHLGLYLSAHKGASSIEFFSDDLYLENYLNDKPLLSGFRYAFKAGSVFSMGLSTLLSLDSSREIKIYPSIDLGFALADKRQLQMDMFVGLTTVLNLNPFENTIWDGDGADIGEMLPNFLLDAGLVLHSGSWDFRLVAAVQNNTAGLLALNTYNQTNFSGERMLDSLAGIYYSFATELAYSGEHFHFGASYQVPVYSTFTGIVPLEADSGVTGDLFALELGYTSQYFEATAGVRRVGFISSLKTVGEFNDGLLGMLKDIGDIFIGPSDFGKLAQPYVNIKARFSAFSLFGELSMVNKADDNLTVPRVTIGATVDLGKNSFKK